VSLYGNPHKKEVFHFNSLLQVPAMPAWLLAMATYLALVTLLNNIPELIGWFDFEPVRDEYIRHLFIETCASIISTVILVLFIFRRYTFCIYYLVIISTLESLIAVTSVTGKTESLSPYLYSLRGLDSVPLIVIGWTIGWNSVTDAYKQVLIVIEPIASLIGCTLLLYLHHKIPSETQVRRLKFGLLTMIAILITLMGASPIIGTISKTDCVDIGGNMTCRVVE
jgi:hypothetical protein